MAKGGSETKEVILPEFFETAIQQNIGLGRDLAPLASTYIPRSGPAVAAQSPATLASYDMNNMAASAFNMPTVDTSGYLPEVVTSGGLSGYSSAPMFEEMVSNIPRGQRDYIESFGIDEYGNVGARAPLNQPVALEMQGGGGRGK